MRSGRESIVGIFPSLPRGHQDGKLLVWRGHIWRIQWTIYSWWDVKQKAKYSGYLGTQGDPRRPNALSLRHQGHSVRAFHFVFELDQVGGLG